MYASFVLIIIGSLIRFIDPDRWLKAAAIDTPSGVELHLWGAERYRSGVLPREGERIVRAALDAGGSQCVIETTVASGDTTCEEADDDR